MSNLLDNLTPSERKKLELQDHLFGLTENLTESERSDFNDFLVELISIKKPIVNTIELTFVLDTSNKSILNLHRYESFINAIRLLKESNFSDFTLIIHK